MTNTELLQAAQRITADHPGVVITFDRNGWAMTIDPDWQLPAPFDGLIFERPATDGRWGTDILAPHGSHAAFNRHKARSEDPCADCWVEERRYQKIRRRNERARSRAQRAREQIGATG